LLYTELRSYSDQGIGLVDLADPSSARMIIDGPYAETRPALSPDGHWVAYQSDETGRFEIYVRPFPDVNAERVPVSTGGGASPRWSPDGREVFFHDGSNMLAVPIRTSPALAAGAPRVLFEASRFNERLGPIYDAAPDVQRFLFLRPGGPDGAPSRRTDLRLVQQWDRVLKERQ
jgi:serine/threonine-protein kinase